MIATITNIEQLNDRDFIFAFDCAEIALNVAPGQFVEVGVSKAYDPFLRRPFSVYSTDGTVIKLLVRVVGRGTKVMSAWRVGDSVDILGPFGNLFTWRPEDTDLILVGGGVGFAPINFLLDRLAQTDKKVHLLFSPKRESELIAHLEAGKNLSVTVAENRAEIGPLLQKMISGVGGAALYACGPYGMMKLVAGLGAENHAPTWLSMEAAMGCGFGICGGCIVPVKDGEDFAYKKACNDGPIFSGEEILFDE
ncbi:MAG: FAD-binding oxidoreductase [Clostridiales bacterium]|nr:FAD-binding oxidoreductase [Clostridiales bacterium]